MSDDAPPAPGNVIVSAERLAELERLERELPTIIAKAKEEAHKERFDKLRERDKENPEEHTKRTMKWYEKNREEINARRREEYKKKKEASKIQNSPGVSLCGGSNEKSPE
jgi:hypothetical protein